MCRARGASAALVRDRGGTWSHLGRRDLSYGMVCQSTKDERCSQPLWSIAGYLTLGRYWLLLKVNSEITNDLRQNPDPIKINGKIN